MLKSEIILQFIIIALTATIVSMLAVKIYPSNLLAKNKIQSNIIIPSPKADNREFLPPESISISSINLDLPIIPGVIQNNEWTLSDDKVSWLSTSNMPGEGNVILYAHNRIKLFGGLKNLSVGDGIKLQTKGKTYYYEVYETRKILPTDVEQILSEREQLTLYTCDGSFDQKRLVVIALPKVLQN